MKTKNVIIALIALLIALPATGQRSIKRLSFNGVSLNNNEEYFVKRLTRKGWKETSRDKEKIMMSGKVSGLPSTIAIVPGKGTDNQTIKQVILSTAEDTPEATKLKYDVLKDWIIDNYDIPAVDNLKDEEGDISCYWGSLSRGERDNYRNHITLTTVDNSVAVATFNFRETATEATMESIGDAVEGFGQKVSNTTDKVKQAGKTVKDNVAGKSKDVAHKTGDALEDSGDWIKRTASKAAKGAKDGWRAFKNAFKSNKEAESN